jgi:hypothetical protein
MYFNGMAINRSSRKDKPSRKPTTRKVLIVIFKTIKLRMNLDSSGNG